MPELPGFPPPGRTASLGDPAAPRPGYLRRVISLGSEDDLARILSSNSVGTTSAQLSPKWAATPTPTQTRTFGSGWGGLRLSGLSPGSGTNQPQPSVGPWPSTPSPWAGGFRGSYSFETAPVLQPVGQPVLVPQIRQGTAPESAVQGVPGQLLAGSQMMWVQVPTAPEQTAPVLMQMPVGMVGGQNILMVAQPVPAFGGDQMVQIPSNGSVAAPSNQTSGDLSNQAVPTLQQPAVGAIPEESSDPPPPPTLPQAGRQLLTEAFSSKTLDNLSADGQPVPSSGSLLHGTGRCNPCAWYWKVSKGCANDKQCTYCHLCPEGELKNRKKEKVKLIRAGVIEAQKPA